MRAVRIGWLLVLLVIIGGYALGRCRRQAALESALAAKSKRPQSPAAAAVSTAGVPVDLPTDIRRTDSVPRGLE